MAITKQNWIVHDHFVVVVAVTAVAAVVVVFDVVYVICRCRHTWFGIQFLFTLALDFVALKSTKIIHRWTAFVVFIAQNIFNFITFFRQFFGIFLALLLNFFVVYCSDALRLMNSGLLFFAHAAIFARIHTHAHTNAEKKAKKGHTQWKMNECMQ